MKFIRTFIIFITITGNLLSSDIEWVLEKKYKFKNLYNPFRMMIHSNHVYLFDMGGDKPFLRIDNNNNEIQFGGWGQGPGEISKGPTQFVGGIESFILIYNNGRRKIFYYNLEGKFQKQLEIPTTSYISAALTSKNTLVLLDYFSDSFSIAYNVLEDLSIENKEAVPIGKYEETPELENCRNNFLLKQGPICTDNKGNVFMGFQFSSLIVGFDDKGTNIFKTLEPENIPIPEVVAKAGVVKAPDAGKHPEVNVSLAVDEKYVYAVYSGTKLTLLNFIYTLDDLFQGDVVHVYNKQTSAYLWSFKLPYPVRDFKVTDDSIFLLSVDPEPALLCFQYPVRLRRG